MGCVPAIIDFRDSGFGIRESSRRSCLADLTTTAASRGRCRFPPASLPIYAATRGYTVVCFVACLMLVDTSMRMILPTSLALDTTKNRRTIDNAFNLQVMQVTRMVREPERRAHTAARQAWAYGLAVEVNLEPLFPGTVISVLVHDRAPPRLCCIDERLDVRCHCPFRLNSRTDRHKGASLTLSSRATLETHAVILVLLTICACKGGQSVCIHIFCGSIY